VRFPLKSKRLILSDCKN